MECSLEDFANAYFRSPLCGSATGGDAGDPRPLLAARPWLELAAGEDRRARRLDRAAAGAGALDRRARPAGALQPAAGRGAWRTRDPRRGSRARPAERRHLPAPALGTGGSPCVRPRPASLVVGQPRRRQLALVEPSGRRPLAAANGRTRPAPPAPSARRADPQAAGGLPGHLAPRPPGRPQPCRLTAGGGGLRPWGRPLRLGPVPGDRHGGLGALARGGDGAPLSPP